MGLYGSYTGVVRWFDPVAHVGHMLVLKDGEVQTDITGDHWASGATGYDEGNGFWLDRTFTAGGTIVAGQPIGLLLSLTYPTDVTIPVVGTTHWFLGDSAGNKITWNGLTLTVVGGISADSGDIGGWDIYPGRLTYDTGVDATSAGMSPSDFPFYSGATYANRASATFRVLPTGEVVAENATITGVINWGAGKGVLDTYGMLVTHDASNYVRIRADPSGSFNDAYYIYTRSSANGSYPLVAQQTYAGAVAGGPTAGMPSIYAVADAGQGVGIRAMGAKFGLIARGVYDIYSTPITLRPSAAVMGLEADIAVAGHIDGPNEPVGYSNTPGTHAAHFEVTFGGRPLRLLQGSLADLVDAAATAAYHGRASLGEFIEFAGKTVSANITANLVKHSDASSSTIAGWVRVQIDDDAARLTTGAYYMPVYTLT